MRIKEIPAKPKQKKRLRVVAYARVSSEKDAAFHSLETQQGYYQEYVSAHSDWELIGIYSDNGISGTTDNRPEFQRMLEDCRAGKIDLVVTKSITRFARNTVVLLETIRELKRLGVDCYFEKEDMHSISPDGELLLTLIAMYAEEEARSTSENQKWRIRKRFENGEPWVGNMLGYRLIEGKLRIVPEEAEVVRRIFDMYLSGMGFCKIASILTSEGAKSRYGGRWSKYGIRTILQNEKYIGNMMLQKTYIEDFRTKKAVKNHGERRRYFVENSHEAIISEAVFNAVEQEMKRRSRYYKQGAPTDYHLKHLFSGMLRCGICGCKYIHMQTNAGKYNKPVYQCNTFNVLGKSHCTSQRIPEDILIEKTKELLQTEELNSTIIRQMIHQIDVPEHNHLVYHLTNGEDVDVYWEHRSRRESWTPEMREAARIKALERYRKEEQ